MSIKTAKIVGKHTDIRAVTQPLMIGKIIVNYPTGDVEDYFELVLDNGATVEVGRVEYRDFQIGDSFTYDDHALETVLYVVIVALIIIVPMSIIFWAILK